MPGADNTYRLVLFDAPDDPQAVRDLMSGVTGDHPTDAMQWVARAPGVWPRPLAEGEVRELLDGLFALGVAAEAWRVDLLPTLAPPRTIHAATCLADGLRAQGLRGEPTHWVPWDRVELIAAGRIEAEDEFREVAPPGWGRALSDGVRALMGRAPAVPRRRRAMRIPRDPVGEVILVRRDPRLALRIVETQMNYAGLGDRLRPSATENFPILLADLCDHAPDAYRTRSTRALLDGLDPAESTFATPGALVDYATHRLLWSWYRRDRVAPRISPLRAARRPATLAPKTAAGPVDPARRRVGPQVWPASQESSPVPKPTQNRHLFTSESVSMGHPDKMADQISDGILDAILAQDPQARVACESLLTTGLVCLAGEVTTKAMVDYPTVVRQVVREIGYTSSEMGFDATTCAVMVALGKQSPDIAQGVDADSASGKDIGAGDQGLMFGYACDETPEFMPLAIALSHRIINKITDLRRDGTLPWLRPDSKSQVTIEYEGQAAKRVHTVVVSTQHAPEVAQEELVKAIREQVILPCLPPELVDDELILHINPTGKFVVGGPHGDSGVTGRKIIVDTYGGRARHGGGAFSGKDPTKVDRSAAYMARYVAKNVVASGLAKACEVQLAYAIGVSEPVSILVDTEGTGEIPDAQIAELIGKTFPLTPSGIIRHLDLRRPIYRKTASGGHFGRDEPEFTWERTDKADALREAAGLAAAMA